jgi:tetratricopeptide (TPR) repeat protein
MFAKAKAAAQKALELDETLGEAYAVLGALKGLDDWDWEGGEKDLKKALELSPSYATAHQWYALFISALGRLEEALAEVKRAHELDPLSLLISTRFGQWLSYSGRNEEAIAQHRKTLAMDPNFGHAHFGLGLALLNQRRYGEALVELRRGTQLLDGDPYILASLGYAYAGAGQRAEARKILEDFQERSKRGYFPSFALAMVSTGLEERDQALEWLRKSLEERDVNLFVLRVDPLFAPLRSDARFPELLRLMKLKP